MTKNSIIKLEILDIISKKGIKQKDEFAVRLNTDSLNVERALRDLVELEIINFVRGCGYVITETMTAFDVMCIIEETGIMLEDNMYKIDDNNLTTIIRGYSKLAEELKQIVFKATSLKQIMEYEVPKRKKYKKRTIMLGE